MLVMAEIRSEMFPEVPGKRSENINATRFSISTFSCAISTESPFFHVLAIVAMCAAMADRCMHSLSCLIEL